MVWTSLIAQTKRRLWMSLSLATLVALVYLHFSRFYQGSGYGWFFVVGWVPVTLNWLYAALGLAYRLDRHPFSLLDLGLVSDQVAPGGAFEVELRSKARRGTELRRLSAELRCTQQKTTEKGRQRTVLQSEESVLGENLKLGVGEARAFRVTLPVSEKAPFSYRSMEGKISWTIHVALDIVDWGELRDELEVVVAPG